MHEWVNYMPHNLNCKYGKHHDNNENIYIVSKIQNTSMAFLFNSETT